MTKAVSISISLLFLMASAVVVPGQTAPADQAVTEAVTRQANTLVLRQKLGQARTTTAQGDIVAAAKLYQEAFTLAENIGSGIEAERAQAVAGLTYTRMTLARAAERQGDLHEADNQVKQVLKADPKNAEALAFKKKNDQIIHDLRSKIPDEATLSEVPAVQNQKLDAGTLVQDGKLLYEMGKLEESEAKLKEALSLDPDNAGAYYYLNLCKQANYERVEMQHTFDTQTRMTDVEKRWVLPTQKNLPQFSNPYATNNLIYTGPGRQIIVNKLNTIRLDTVPYDGLPLSEVVRNLTEQSKIRDPERKGINFLINPNAEAASVTTGAPVAPGGGPTPVDPATGLPMATSTGGAGGGGEAVDVGGAMIKLNLTDVRLADVLDAIVTVSDHPIKYSILDYGIVFSAKGPETPQMFMRTFKVDPNTFYSGLESVGAETFGGVNNTGGNAGGGGNSGGGGGGNNNNFGGVVPVVNAAPGSAGLRTQGNGAGGGGGGGAGQGSVNPLGNTGVGGGGGVTGNGGLRYVTSVNLASDVSAAARSFFVTLGVNLDPPKAIFFNDRLGLLFVKATETDLDTIDRAIQALNQVAPQVHIKSRFIEVQQSDNKALGFDWYLGNFVNGTIVANGGSAPSLNVPVSAANPLGAFPGNSTASLVPASANDQLLTGGLRNSGPTLATVTGILTDPNFRVAIHALEQRSGFETLAEPEVTTASGRQTQMRATQLITVITGFNFQQGTSGAVTTGTGTTQ